MGAWHLIIDDYSNKFVHNILTHNLSTFMMTKHCYLIETNDDIIYSPSITIKKIEESIEEDISSIKSYLVEKTKKMVKYHYLQHLAEIELNKLGIGWGSDKRKSIYEKHGLTENGWGLLGEGEIPYSWKKLVFVSDKKLTKDDLKNF